MAKTENTIELRVIATGAAQAAQVLNTVAASGAQVGTKVSQGADAAKKSLTGLTGSVQGISGLMGQAGIQTGILGQALGALSSPAGLAGVAFVGLALGIQKATNAMTENAKAVRSLMAVSGLSAAEADNLADTFALLGKDSSVLTQAMFKMSAEIESGGAKFRALGISLRDSQGQLKSEGELFLELRDRISQMGTASQRSAAMTAFFGKAARELTAEFAMSREEFARWQAKGNAVSEWTQKMQRDTEKYERTLAEFTATFNALWISVGTKAIPQATAFIGKMTELINKFRELDLSIPEWLKRAMMGAGTAMFPGLQGLLQQLTPGQRPEGIPMPRGEPSSAETRAALGALGLGGAGGLGGLAAGEEWLKQQLALIKAREQAFTDSLARVEAATKTSLAQNLVSEQEALEQSLQNINALEAGLLAFNARRVALAKEGAGADLPQQLIELEAQAAAIRNKAALDREATAQRLAALDQQNFEMRQKFIQDEATLTENANRANLEAMRAAALERVQLTGTASEAAIAQVKAEMQQRLEALSKGLNDEEGMTEAFLVRRAEIIENAALKIRNILVDLAPQDPFIKKLMGEEAEWAKAEENLNKIAAALELAFKTKLTEVNAQLANATTALGGNREAIERNQVAWELAKTTFDKLPPSLQAVAANIAKVNLELADTANAKKWADELASIERQAQLLGPSFDLLAAKLDLAKRKMLEASDPAKGLTGDVAALKEEFDRLSDIKEVRDAMTDILSSVGNAINTLVQGVILGTQKMSDAFKKLGQSIIQEFVNQIIQRALKPLVGATGDVIAALFGFAVSAASSSGGGGGGIVGGTGSSGDIDFGGGSGVPSISGGGGASSALGLLNKGATTIGAAGSVFQSGALIFQHTVLGFQGASGVAGLSGGVTGFMVGLDAVANSMGVMSGVFAGVTAAIAIAFTAMRKDITDTGKAILSAGYAIAAGFAIAAVASGQGYLLLISAGVALVTAILDWTGVFKKSSDDWIKFSGKLTHTLGLEQDAVIALGTALQGSKSLAGFAEAIVDFRHRIEGAGVGGFFAATAGRGAFTVPGIPGATGTPHEGGIAFDFGPYIQQFQDAINKVLDSVRDTISTKMPEIAKKIMPADIADAFISGTLQPLRAEFEALIASSTTTIEQIEAFEERLNSMGDLMAGFGTAAGAIDILKKGATKALPEDIAPGVIKSADELRAKLLDLAKSGTATKEELEALIGQIQLLSQVAQMMGEAAFVLKELGAVANESLGELGPTVGASVEKLRAELVTLANSGTATAAQLAELQARIAALGSQVALYMRLHDEIALLSGDIDQVTERMIVNMRASFSAADRAIEAAGEQLAKAIDSPDIAAAQVAMEQAILNRYKLERDLIAQIEETIQDILNQRGPSLITNAMRAVNDALERTDTRPLLHMITALEGVQRASISASAKLWAATAAIQALAAAVPSIVRGFQSQITDPTQFAQALLDAAMPSLETIAGLYGKAIAAGDINSALLALEAGSGAILGLADAAIAGVRQWEAAAVAAAEAAAAAQIDAVNAAAQAQIDAVNATAQADIDRINAEAEAAIEANDARIDALNDERDAIEEMIRLSREWAQVVEDIDKMISDLMTGGASPLNPAEAFKFAQQQYQQALAAFQATPTAANAAQVQQTAQAMLNAFQVMRPAGRPSPEYEALVNETVAQLRAIQAFAAGQVTPEEQSLKRLESIDAEIKALNDSNEMIREAADAQIEAIEAARDGQIKAIEAARDLQIKAIETARDVQVAGIHAAAQATVDGINREVARVMGEIAKEQARLIGLQIEQQEKILREITGGKDTQTYMLLLNKTTAGALANLRDMVYASLTGADPPAPNNAPPLARGGIVMKPTYALIGEAGPEVVRPLAQDQARGGTTTLAIENVTIHVGQGENPRVAGREAADAFERRLIELIRAKPHVRHALRMFLRDGL